MADDPLFLVVGIVRRPHGIRGAVTVTTTTDHPDDVFRRGRVLRVGDRSGNPDGPALTVRSASPHKGGYLVHFEELTELGERVDELRGRTLVMPASEAVAPGEDEFFFHELVDLEVVHAGEAIGTVRDVLELPSGLAISVRREGRRDAIVPFVGSMVKKVDVDAGVVEIDPPEGLLDL